MCRWDQGEPAELEDTKINENWTPLRRFDPLELLDIFVNGIASFITKGNDQRKHSQLQLNITYKYSKAFVVLCNNNC